VTLRVAAAVALAGVGVALFAARLVAPGPADFYIEPETGMVLVAVRPGSFMMGTNDAEPGRRDDEYLHRVTITQLFYIGQHEVTQAEWARVMGSNPSRFTGCEKCPVEQVDFYQVNAFLSRINAGNTAMRFRLPTEAEWEYACRAGSRTAFSGGAQLPALAANVDTRFMAGPEDGAAYEKTLPAGRFPANKWGVHDMHGNVWEWTNDWYGPYDPRREFDPRGADSGTRKAIRGGSWRFDAMSARCSARQAHPPQDAADDLGFRVVAEPRRPRRR